MTSMLEIGKNLTFIQRKVMDSFMINHQAALDSQREAQAIREQIGDEDDISFNHKQQEEDFDFDE